MNPFVQTGQTAALPLAPPLEAGMGGLFASIALVYLLGYVNLVDATDAYETLERSLIALLLPLLVVFVATLVDRTLTILLPAP
jgi:hypothetical protein